MVLVANERWHENKTTSWIDRARCCSPETTLEIEPISDSLMRQPEIANCIDTCHWLLQSCWSWPGFVVLTGRSITLMAVVVQLLARRNWKQSGQMLQRVQSHMTSERFSNVLFTSKSTIVPILQGLWVSCWQCCPRTATGLYWPNNPITQPHPYMMWNHGIALGAPSPINANILCAYPQMRISHASYRPIPIWLDDSSSAATRWIERPP